MVSNSGIVGSDACKLVVGLCFPKIIFTPAGSFKKIIHSKEISFTIFSFILIKDVSF